MKFIVPVAVLAIWALQASGAVPNSSVGGPMTLAIVYFAAVLVVAIYEAWVSRRGPLAYIANIVVAFVGSFIAAEVANLAFEASLMALSAGGALVEVRPSLFLYAGLAAMMVVMLLGAWGAIQLVNRWRDRAV